jgi:hypothetical protein
MSKVNKNSINWSLKTLTILAFGLAILPVNKAMAVTPTYVPAHYNDDGSYTFGNFVMGNSNNGSNNTETPSVTSISPKYITPNANTTIVTVVGSGFVPGSMVKLNGSSRPATFIDSAHLLVQVAGNDARAYQGNGGLYITVWNPDGQYSNAAFLKINNTTVAYNNNYNYGYDNGYNNYNQNQNYDPNAYTGTAVTGNSNSLNPNYTANDLASNAIFGTNSFLPSGLIQWLILAIIVIAIVILARRIFGARQNYEEAPMKHA